jgi:single-strand DNA-binding protein
MAQDISQLTVTGTCQPSDPESRFTADGKQITSFRFVSAQDKKSKTTGEWEDHSTWYRVTAFGYLAEKVQENVAKGTRLLVIGNFQNREWTDNDGNKRAGLEILADRIEVLPARQKRQSQSSGSAPSSAVDDLEDLPF